jgi:hypothetical protein
MSTVVVSLTSCNRRWRYDDYWPMYSYCQGLSESPRVLRSHISIIYAHPFQNQVLFCQGLSESPRVLRSHMSIIYGVSDDECSNRGPIVFWSRLLRNSRYILNEGSQNLSAHWRDLTTTSTSTRMSRTLYCMVCQKMSVQYATTVFRFLISILKEGWQNLSAHDYSYEIVMSITQSYSTNYYRVYDTTLRK